MNLCGLQNSQRTQETKESKELQQLHTLQILSDLHLEFCDLTPSRPPCDALILAGDIHVKNNAIDWINTHFSDIPVIYIVGNHEYYGETYPKHLDKLKERCADSNIYLLENNVITLGGVHFIGATLWTDFELFGDPRIYGQFCQAQMNDYRLIRRLPNYSRLRSIDTAMIHKASRRFLEKQLQALPPDELIVVVTHHAPSVRSLPEHKRDQWIASAYASDLEAFIAGSPIDLWVHGHIHHSSDYKIGGTRIVCNPRGYPNKFNPAFNDSLVLSLV